MADKRNRHIFALLGSSNHAEHIREKDDFYSTDPKASEYLMKLEKFSDTVFDNSIGRGDLMLPFIKEGYNVVGCDIVYRGCEEFLGEWKDKLEYKTLDFLSAPIESGTVEMDIVFNPPYKYATEFIRKSLDIVADGYKVCAFVRTLYLESQERANLFKEFPPKTVYVSSRRLRCHINGDVKDTSSSATSYSWFVWEKGYKGDTVVKWFNTGLEE